MRGETRLKYFLLSLFQGPRTNYTNWIICQDNKIDFQGVESRRWLGYYAIDFLFKELSLIFFFHLDEVIISLVSKLM